MTLSGFIVMILFGFILMGLNPSFSGCPALGYLLYFIQYYCLKVLIPLLVDVPLWAVNNGNAGLHFKS